MIEGRNYVAIYQIGSDLDTFISRFGQHSFTLLKDQLKRIPKKTRKQLERVYS